MTLRLPLYVLGTAALWGASYLFITVALDDGASEAFIVCLRTVLGACILVPLAARAGGLRPLLDRRGWMLALAAVQVIVPFGLITFAEHWIASGLTAILIASAPLFLALMAPWLDREERSTGLALAGVVIGMAGVVLLLATDLEGTGSRPALGAALVLGAAAIYAVAPLIVKRGFGGVPPVGVAAGTMVVSAVVWAPWALADLPSHGLPITSWLALAALGAGGTGIAFLMFYELIAEVGPARASVIAYVAPLFSVLYGVLLLDERFTGWTLAGMVLILGGSWLAARRSTLEPVTD